LVAAPAVGDNQFTSRRDDLDRRKKAQEAQKTEI
jgi:hypothetical protein